MATARRRPPLERSGPIVCPVDYSEHSEAALRRAGAWAKRSGMPLIVLTVERFDLPPYLTPELLGDPRSPEAGEKASLRYLKEFAAGLLPRGLRARYSVLAGSAAEEILALTRRERAAALVLGTHGRGGVRAAMMGSTTERVAAEAAVPLLVLRAGAEGDRSAAFRRIVIPDDGSPAVTLLQAAARPFSSGRGAAFISAPVADWASAGAAEEVLRAAAERRADLIVVRLAARRLQGRVFPDQNTTEVMRRSPCPVLVLPPAGIR